MSEEFNQTPTASEKVSPAGSLPDSSDVQDDGVTTIFEDPMNFNVKHPLEHRWTLWFDNPGKKATQANWAFSLKNLITLDSVEDFWGVYNNVQKAGQLPAGSNYHLFKEGVRPEWEDPRNAKGGKWVLQLAKKRQAELDQLWLFTLLACVGETFTESDEICGAVVSIRKAQDRIALWTKNALDQEKVEQIGQQWKKSLGLGDGDRIGYQAHSDALRKNSSFSNADMYVV
ncbi:hypothetical protein HK104_009787 [Borealophlyctis nickersoniae]|nr:hypothetical protein HK104_009787 [Borealophlyctis nickersoniae]